MLTKLTAVHFRNISQLDISPSPSINLLLGENGSGKTSILEAIHLLAVGRSFRTRSMKNLIQTNHRQTQVFARTHSATPVGFQYNINSGLQIRLNNAPLKRMSELVVNLPLQYISANCHQFFELGPKFRRKIIDWGLFHIEPSFNYHWQTYRRALQQRNAAIKQHKKDQEIQLWDNYLIQHGEQITEQRRVYLETLLVEFISLFETMCPGFNNSEYAIRYAKGWSKEEQFAAILVNNLLRDKSLGYTRSGPHSADWSVKINDADPQEMLSRGQQKLFYLALTMAQIKLLNKRDNTHSVLLIDDLSSELDETHQQLVLTKLLVLPVQTFITSTNLAMEHMLSTDKTAMFHVKQGEVTLSSSEAELSTNPDT